jgi:RNA polymerase sigma-70 factor (ECF subfamily)
MLALVAPTLSNVEVLLAPGILVLANLRRHVHCPSMDASGFTPGPLPPGTASAFATIHWSVVLAAREPKAPQAVEALEKLCRIYWRPLYAFIRREGYGVQDAQDLTQGFFAALLDKGYLRHLRDQRGKFRSFLLTFLKHFLSDERDKASAQKRGGGKTFVSLDDTSVEERWISEPATAGGLSPDQLFGRRWAETILEQAAERLRSEYAADGKTALFEGLKDFQPGVHGPVSYQQAGAGLGMTESAIKSSMHRMRRRHREILREEIAHTVSRPEEVDEEIRYLLTILSA